MGDSKTRHTPLRSEPGTRGTLVRPLSYAQIWLPDGLYRMVRTRGGRWCEFFSGSKRVWDCNPTFAATHFVASER